MLPGLLLLLASLLSLLLTFGETIRRTVESIPLEMSNSASRRAGYTYLVATDGC